MTALRTRDRRPERMDDPSLPAADHRLALRGLERINRVTGSAAVVWKRIEKVARRLNRPVRVLDVATGSGDIPVSLAAIAKRRNVAAEFAGCDISPTAIDAAKARAPFHWFMHDVLKSPLPDGYDIVTCSLFLHHLDRPDAVTLLREMGRAAARRVVVNDLSRGPVNYALVWLACRLLSRSQVVREDGPLSVRAAFTPAEAVELATEAGLTGAKARPLFPCRFVLTWDKPT
jgi:2-polyprenyl-3-methyl-5-hydroxy-6-metoxy-1,4-benzoquinol methylase